MAQKEMENEEYDPIAQILDPENNDVVTLVDEAGDEQKFDQIAVIPIGEELFAILHPLTIKGVGEEEVWVFAFVEVNGEMFLIVEEDENKVQKVFDEYNRLLKEGQKK